MKRSIFLFSIMLIASTVFSQSSDMIRKEASTDYVYKPDNSLYAKLWQKQVDARKSGDMETYNNVSKQITENCADKFTSGEPVTADMFRVINHQQPPFTPDVWGSDITVYANAVGGTSVGNPTAFNRNVRLGADTLGNQYASFLSGNKDTIIVFKSTNQGAAWTRIFSVLGSGAGYIHSFDMHVTDSLSSFRLGFAITIINDADPTYAGSMYWLSVDQSGTAISVTPVVGTASGRGYISPALVSDGFTWSAGLTYWYMTYQNVDATTGVGTQALLAWSTNWGRTWLLDTARNTFNDYELDIDYNFGGDSIYVLLTNNLTTTNENLRLMYNALGNLGTGVAFKQVNPANAADHDRLGTVAMNRTTNEIAVLYTKFTGTNQDIRVSYSPDGTGPIGRWTVDQTVSGLPGNENNSTIKGQDRQGAFRLAFVSQGSGFDTVVYMSGFTAATLSGRTVVNTNSVVNNAPDVVGYRSGAGFDGGVLYSGTSALYYDGSPLLTGVEPVGGVIPSSFALQQNYPNPFNPATTIKFSVPKSGIVLLKVYDVAGREVASLISGELIAGNYKAEFNASQLGSGVYFYKLVADGFTETKKMILIK
ncbi:MAG TPA: T9SS type A sorting domain-containing protein [Ignavibacteria bacterium]|nr:T9SS type A sorting domain-containing protein [Ignavibacteria bacterium]HRF65273.1 T9SS type A sorting domain-containing protein [Ignavibacteria bacterium]HRJ05791.1 T9SS type A sorting domain-containing protein [Ignavibacteria bacterium]